MESIRRDAMAMLIAEGGPASLAGIMWTPGSIQLAGIAVQLLSVAVDATLVVGLALVAGVLPGPVVGTMVGGLVWLTPPVFWRLYGRTPGMAIFGLYVVHLTRDDMVRPSVLLGLARIILLCLTMMLVPFARTGHLLSAMAASKRILPADRVLDMRVFRYRLVAPPGRTRGDRVLDRLGVLAAKPR